MWRKEITRLIKKGLSNDEIVNRVPFRSEYVAHERLTMSKGV